jgi:hypothetical protein
VLPDELRPLTGRYELLFPNQNKITNPISENTMTYALYRLGYKSRATVHGFQATARTILNEQSFDPDIIERQLAHTERNKVRAAYHHAEYLDDRRKLMQWSNPPEQDSIMKPQYIVNEQGERTFVVLPITEYEALLEDLEDLAAVAEKRYEPTISQNELEAQLRTNGLL